MKETTIFALGGLCFVLFLMIAEGPNVNPAELLRVSQASCGDAQVESMDVGLSLVVFCSDNRIVTIEEWNPYREPTKREITGD